jgi:membrane protein
MVWSTSDKMMGLRARHPAIEVGVDTLDGWRRHISGRNASVVAFFGFLSIFPLMLAATTILGLVLKDNEELQQRIIDGALADIPVLGAELENDPASLDGSIWVLVLGLAVALWSATKAFVALQGALDDVWEVDVDHRDAMPKQRSKALLGLVLIGGAQIAGLAMSTIVAEANLAVWGRVLLTGGNLVINVVVVAAMFRYLTAASTTWRDVRPGALTAGVAATLIQHFGTRIVVQISSNASDTYGQFALVLGIVTWLSLLAIATIMSAEFNAALLRQREGSIARVQPPADPADPAADPAAEHAEV